MRRKAKELQQARRDAERSGKKVPAFGGFGSAALSSVSSGSIITDTIVEPEKPKITPAPVRSDSKRYMFQLLLDLNIFLSVYLIAIWCTKIFTTSHHSFDWECLEFNVFFNGWRPLFHDGVFFSF